MPCEPKPPRAEASNTRLLTSTGFDSLVVVIWKGASLSVAASPSRTDKSARQAAFTNQLITTFNADRQLKGVFDPQSRAAPTAQTGGNAT